MLFGSRLKERNNDTDATEKQSSENKSRFVAVPFSDRHHTDSVYICDCVRVSVEHVCLCCFVFICCFVLCVCLFCVLCCVVFVCVLPLFCALLCFVVIDVRFCVFVSVCVFGFYVCIVCLFRFVCLCVFLCLLLLYWFVFFVVLLTVIGIAVLFPLVQIARVHFICCSAAKQ